MSNQNYENVEVIVSDKKPSLFQRVKHSFAVGLASATALALTQGAHAAELDFSGVTSELDGVKTAIVALITILLTIFAIVIAWRTFRRSS